VYACSLSLESPPNSALWTDACLAALRALYGAAKRERQSSKEVRARTLVSLCLVAFCCAACVPFPHSVTLTPELLGHVTASGVPVRHATLLLANTYRENPCSDALPIGTTNAEGAFRFEEKRQTRLFHAPLVVPIATSVYAICIRHGGEYVLGFRGTVMQRDSKSVQLVCDLRRPYMLKDGDGFQAEAVCRAIDRAAPLSSNKSIDTDVLLAGFAVLLSAGHLQR
jgi:hypothetical protein